SRSFERLV
ncbi:hypothetical protein VCHENC02_5290B, partial [Vibrio harveyi]